MSFVLNPLKALFSPSNESRARSNVDARSGNHAFSSQRTSHLSDMSLPKEFKVDHSQAREQKEIQKLERILALKH